MIKDVNKGIINISYNYQDLPVQLDKQIDTRLEYQYDATGNKLRQTEIYKGLVSKTTDFVGNFVYVYGKPAWNNYDEGRVVYNTNGTYITEAYLKDHLGNVRVAFGFEGALLKVRQVNSYYAFGMNIKELSKNGTNRVHPNEYLYNGKMMQDEQGLNWLDYGARFYDAVLGRWHGLDPLGEKYPDFAGYIYCRDNPITRIDLLGLTDYEVKRNGEVKKKEGTENNEGPDRLIARKARYDKKTGELKNKEKNVLNIEKGSLEILAGEDESGAIQLIKTTPGENADKTFEFLVEHTDVEFSKADVSGGTMGNKSLILTEHSKENAGPMATFLYGYSDIGKIKRLDSYTHNHNNSISENQNGQTVANFGTGTNSTEDNNTLKALRDRFQSQAGGPPIFTIYRKGNNKYYPVN